jgi:hypothetical protein
MKARFFSRVLFLTFGLLQQPDTVRQPSPWDTCIYVEGKADFCRSGENARKFEAYLRPDWLKQPVDGFTVNTGLDRLQPRDTFKATWREVGVLGSSRIRQMEYLVNGMLVLITSFPRIN